MVKKVEKVPFIGPAEVAAQQEHEKKRRYGFAAMSEEKRLAAARKGGKSAFAKGTGHRFKAGDEGTVAAAVKGGAGGKGSKKPGSGPRKAKPAEGQS